MGEQQEQRAARVHDKALDKLTSQLAAERDDAREWNVRLHTALAAMIEIHSDDHFDSHTADEHEAAEEAWVRDADKLSAEFLRVHPTGEGTAEK